jgi:DNA-binding IclR family transcriptional regulator
MSSQPSRTVQATETSITILEALHDLGQAGVTELSNQLSLSKGNVHKHLTTLEQNEFVVNEGGVYSLSHRFLELGKEVQRSTPASEHVVPLLESVAESVGDSAFFAVKEHEKVVYLLVVSRPNGVNPGIEGRRYPLSETASGKVILAFGDTTNPTPPDTEGADSISAKQRSQIRDNELVIRTPSDESFSELAVPVRHHSDGLVGVVGLFTDSRDHDEFSNEYRRLLQSTSERIAKRIAWNQSN